MFSQLIKIFFSFLTHYQTETQILTLLLKKKSQSFLEQRNKKHRNISTVTSKKKKCIKLPHFYVCTLKVCIFYKIPHEQRILNNISKAVSRPAFEDWKEEQTRGSRDDPE